MKFRTAFILLVFALITSCSTAHHKVWKSPNKTTELRFVKGPQGPTQSNEDSFSFYSLHEGSSNKPLISVRSIINEGTSDFVHKQIVHFSPSGKTILIEEDISDASPDYVYTLIQQNGERYFSRDLDLPKRHNSFPSDLYGIWPDVVSVTDESIYYRYNKDEPTISVKISELRDRGF